MTTSGSGADAKTAGAAKTKVHKGLLDQTEATGDEQIKTKANERKCLISPLHTPTLEAVERTSRSQ
jgi:hypothetical protein